MAKGWRRNAKEMSKEARNVVGEFIYKTSLYDR